MMMIPSRRNFFDEVFDEPIFSKKEAKMMKTDIKEKDGNYIFTIDVPGFEKENTLEIESVFPLANYKVMSLDCTSVQKEEIARQLLECYKQRYRYHYCILGLPFLLLGIPFYQRNHYTCSSFIARILKENGLELFEKHFSLVTPRDFYELENVKMIYEGTLHDFNMEFYWKIGAAYES